MQKPPTFLERLQHKKYLYLVLIQAALAAEVRDGRAVYHGNAGHLLLKGGAHVLRVRIIAPIELRVTMARERLKLSRSEALDYIARMDQDRRKWVHYLYGVEWSDPGNYDIVLNLESMQIKEACYTISTLARQRCFEFTPACRAAMDDLALAGRVRAELALDRATSHLEFEVRAKDGAVGVRGAVSHLRGVADVRRIAGSVPGVSTLDLEKLASPVRP